MSGFDREWLALREPVDARARDAALLDAAAEAVGEAERKTILDIGCGTGATYRALSPRLDSTIRWQLLDNDEALLDEARRLHGEAVTLIRTDLNAIQALPLSEAGLVTASALFDLCSEDFIDRFVTQLAEGGTELYAALSYDGEMNWSKPHPLDGVFTATFNAHQLSDKGFGPALGPQATTVLTARLKARGYQVRTAESPWVMTPEDADMQRIFLNGIVRAVLEYGELDEAEIRDWVDYRQKMVTDEASSCRVGHQDILALR